jgi:hypothetical protein
MLINLSKTISTLVSQNHHTFFTIKGCFWSRKTLDLEFLLRKNKWYSIFSVTLYCNIYFIVFTGKKRSRIHNFFEKFNEVTAVWWLQIIIAFSPPWNYWNAGALGPHCTTRKGLNRGAWMSLFPWLHVCSIMHLKNRPHLRG